MYKIIYVNHVLTTCYVIDVTFTSLLWCINTFFKTIKFATTFNTSSIPCSRGGFPVQKLRRYQLCSLSITHIHWWYMVDRASVSQLTTSNISCSLSQESRNTNWIPCIFIMKLEYSRWTKEVITIIFKKDFPIVGFIFIYKALTI